MDKPLLTDDVKDKVVSNYNGWHPIHIAAFQGNHQKVLKLIKEGAYISPIDIWGKTPLHYARYRKYGINNDKVGNSSLKSF